MSVAMCINIPYSLKLSGTKIFVDFVDFETPTINLSLKISYKLASPTNLYYMHFATGALNIQLTSVTEQRVRWDNSS